MNQRSANYPLELLCILPNSYDLQTTLHRSGFKAIEKGPYGDLLLTDPITGLPSGIPKATIVAATDAINKRPSDLMELPDRKIMLHIWKLARSIGRDIGLLETAGAKA